MITGQPIPVVDGGGDEKTYVPRPAWCSGAMLGWGKGAMSERACLAGTLPGAFRLGCPYFFEALEFFSFSACT